MINNLAKVHIAIATVIMIVISIMITMTYAQGVPINNDTSSRPKIEVPYATSINSTKVKSGDTKFFTYKNATYGIQIQYPSDWLYKGSNNTVLSSGERIQTVVLFVPSKSNSSQDIFRSPVGLKISVLNSPLNNLSRYVTSTVGSLKRDILDFHLINSNPSVPFAGNNTAQSIAFTAAGEKNMAIFTLKSGMLYLVRYFASSEAEYSQYLPMIQKMIESFRIMGLNTNNTSTSAINKVNQSENLLTYKNTTYGIELQYPSEWLIEQSNDPGIVVRFRSAMNNVISIWTRDLLTNANLDNDVEVIVDSLRKSMTNFNLLGSNQTLIAGNNPAKIILFIAKARQHDVQQMDIITIKGNKEYLITYAGIKERYTADLPNVQRMINSFKIT